MEVYGAGYADDVDYVKYNVRLGETHAEAMAKQLEKVVQCYDLSITLVAKHQLSSTTLPGFKNHFLSFLSFQRSIFRNLLAM